MVRENERNPLDITFRQTRLPDVEAEDNQHRAVAGEDFMYNLFLTVPTRSLLIKAGITSLSELELLAAGEFTVQGLDAKGIQELRAAIAEFKSRDEAVMLATARAIGIALKTRFPTVKPDEKLWPGKKRRGRGRAKQLL